MLKQNATETQHIVDDEAWKRLGQALRREREACALTVREIERRSGVTYRTLYAYERAENQGGIDLKKLVALCGVIGCDPCDLIGEAMHRRGNEPSTTKGGRKR